MARYVVYMQHRLNKAHLMTDMATIPKPTPKQRRWMTLKQFAADFPGFSEAAMRKLHRDARPHFNSRGQWVEGNGLANAFCQPGGKHGKLLIDALAFQAWLEAWTIDAREAAQVA